jgi:hypothetical protein
MTDQLRVLWCSGFNDGECEAVVAFDADGLDGGGVETRVVAKLFEEGACSGDAGVGIGLVDDGSFANNVVAEDEGSWTREFDGPIEIAGIVGLIGVEEDEVERGRILRVQGGEGIESRTDANIDQRREACALNVRAGNGSVLRVEFKRDELAVGGQSTSEPNGGVAAEGSDLEDAACALNARKKMEQLALIGSYVDSGKTGAGIGFERIFDTLVRRDQRVGEAAVNFVPEFLIHR